MEVVTGKAAFPGIAIGKIAWFSRGKYQKNQRTADDILEEKELLFKAVIHILAYLEKAADTAIPEVAETLALYGDAARGGTVSVGKGAQKQARERQFALDLYELGAIDRAELQYRLKAQ